VAFYPMANWGIFNVPTASTKFVQHIVNTQTGAWCKFTGMDARCWALFNNELYFGGADTIYKANSGTSDNGAAILGIGQTAWNYLGARGTQKRFTSVRPIIQADGDFTFNCGTGVDFSRISPNQVASSTTGNTSPWDTSPWDSSPWSDELAVNQNWFGAEGIGYNVAARLELLTSTRSVEWFATQYLYEAGRGGF